MRAITNEITHYLSYLHHGGFFSHLGLRCAHLAFSFFASIFLIGFGFPFYALSLLLLFLSLLIHIRGGV